MTKKFIIENGVVKLNPIFITEQSAIGRRTTVANTEKSLALVSSLQDIREIENIWQHVGGELESLSEPAYELIRLFNQGENFENIIEFFSQHEVPLGLLTELAELKNKDLHFIVDDSSCMTFHTMKIVMEATPYVRARCRERGKLPSVSLSRWEEAEDRIHVFIDLLKYLSINSVTFSFINRKEHFTVQRETSCPDEFGKRLHHCVMAAFNPNLQGHFPVYEALNRALSSDNSSAQFYLISAGIPREHLTTETKSMLAKRLSRTGSKLTLIHCGEKEKDADWMKALSRGVSDISVTTDFYDERDEVHRVHGPTLPYSRGFWLVKQLAGAFNQLDSQCRGEQGPFSKPSLEAIMGRQLLAGEYQCYVNHHEAKPPYSPRIFQARRQWSSENMHKEAQLATACYPKKS